MLDIDAVRATQRLIGRGFEAYLVGGCVRDLLLGRTPKDYDIATEARPPQVKRVFPRNCRIIGRRFKLAHLHFHGNTKILECSTFRRSPQQGEGGDDVLIVRDNEFGTAEEDALRRDFTVNALFLDPTRDTILDYTDGLQDVRDRVIRTIGDPVVRFREDPVRILRAAKFAGRLGFSVEPNTLAAMAETAGDLVRSAPPRVLEEILRLLRGGHALDSFQLLRDIGAIRSLVPVLADFLAEADHDERVDFWRLLEALDHRVQNGYVPNSGVLLGVLLVCPVLAKVERHPGRSASSIAEELLGPLGNSLRLPRRDAGCLKRICGVQHRFLQSDDQKRFRTEGFLHGPYFPEALELFELRMLARGGNVADAEHWRDLAGDLLHGYGRDRGDEDDDHQPPAPAEGDGDGDGDGHRQGHDRQRDDAPEDDPEAHHDDRRNPFAPAAPQPVRGQRHTPVAPAAVDGGDDGREPSGPAGDDRQRTDGEQEGDGPRRRRRRRRRRRGGQAEADGPAGDLSHGSHATAPADAAEDLHLEPSDAPASVRAKPVRADRTPAAATDGDLGATKDLDDEDIDVDAALAGPARDTDEDDDRSRPAVTAADWPAVDADSEDEANADGSLADGGDPDGSGATSPAAGGEGEPGRRRKRRRRRRGGRREDADAPFPASQPPAPHGEAVDPAIEHEPVPFEEIVLDPGAPPTADEEPADVDLDAANAAAEAIADRADEAGAGGGRRRRRRRGRGRGDGQAQPQARPPQGQQQQGQRQQQQGQRQQQQGRPQHGHQQQGRQPQPGQRHQPQRSQDGQPRQGQQQQQQQRSKHAPDQANSNQGNGNQGHGNGGDRNQRRRDRDRRPSGPRDVDVVPRHRDRRGKVEVIEPAALDLSAFDVELDPKRVPTFGSIVEGKGRPKRRSPRVPDDGVDDYRPPPPPGTDGPPPPPPTAPNDAPDTFGDW